MDGHNELIVRWDNAPHHPSVDTFPHHIHNQKGIFSSQQPTLQQVLQEYIQYC